MSREVIALARSYDRLEKVETRFQEIFKENGGEGDWKEVGKAASRKLDQDKQLTPEEKLAHELGWDYYSEATRIYNEEHKRR